MAMERRWAAIAPRAFVADGDGNGTVQLADTYPFKVKQQVDLVATGLPEITLEVKRVISATLLYVGPIGASIDARSDISAYTVLLGATISADEQERSSIPEQKIPRLGFEEEPVVAHRVFPVDTTGNGYSASNPLPVTIGGSALAPSSYDTVNIVRDSEDDPIQYQFLLNSVSVGNIDVVYNSNKSAVQYKKA